MITTTGQPAETEPLSVRLRGRSSEDHRRAETTTILRDLLGGRLARERYVAMIEQLLLVYGTLEAVGSGLADDPVAGEFISTALLRRDALEADVVALHGGGVVPDPAPLPATATYCDRILATADWPGGFVAHHYTRYLGDLSGGPVVGRAAARAFDLAPGAGLDFYEFPRITDPDAFKRAYRDALDAAPWSAAEQERIGDEVRVAYACNVALLDALAEVPA